ncbi:MAG TPA: hypothetical protein VNI35_07865 [Nitrospira sp.]|nr:hypothetical protein [Nitrospira sp.]
MTLQRVLAWLACLILAALAVSPALQAANNDSWNKKTTVSFTRPFEIPGGKVLPAGTYVFKLLDSPYDRDIVQIFNEDQTEVYATILAIPNYHLNPAGETVIRFEERAVGTPEAIKAWFHPNERWGHEFVYPRERAMEIAKVTGEPVPEAPLPVTTAKEIPAVSLERVPVKAAQPSGEEVAPSEAFGTAPEQAAALPKTASQLPLIGLIGLLSLGAGFALWIVSKRGAES